MSEENATIDKVLEVALENFRGWGGKHALTFRTQSGKNETSGDHDAEIADVVLITSANGRGKSSLMEALSHILNQAGMYDNTSLGTLTKAEGASAETKAQEPKASIAAKKHDTIENVSLADVKWTTRLDGLAADHLTRPMLRRASLYVQDKVESQVESSDPTEKDTLLDFLAPFPPWLDNYKTAVASKRSLLETQKPSQSEQVPPGQIESARRRVEESAEKFLPLIVALRPPPQPVTEAGALDQLRDYARRTLGSEDLAIAFPSWRRLLAEERPGSPETRKRIIETQDALEQAAQALARHRQDWPIIDEFLAWGEGPTRIDDLLDLLAALAGRRSDWLEDGRLNEALARLPGPSRRLTPSIELTARTLRDEFRRIDPTRAADLGNAVRTFRDFWKQRRQERLELERTFENLQQELERLRRHGVASEADRALDVLERAFGVVKSLEGRDWAYRDRLRTWEKIAPLIETLNRHLSELERLQEDYLEPEVLEHIRKTLEAVMTHFVVAGFESNPERLKVRKLGRQLEPGLADDRLLFAHFSTGQKAQTALAWLLATNALLQRWMPHRLLLLDDVSTALDLGNLAAECMLLRKFAYTKDKKRKRQVVIASHHDQLTGRIFDLLLPPRGYCLREIRLGDWSLEHGPQVETHRIRPARTADPAALEDLAKRLGDTMRFGVAA